MNTHIIVDRAHDLISQRNGFVLDFYDKVTRRLNGIVVSDLNSEDLVNAIYSIKSVCRLNL